MDIAGNAKTVLAQFVTAWHAPVPFVVAVAVVGWLIWKALGWRYAGTIQQLEERFKLKDDRIAHLTLNVASERATGLVAVDVKPVAPSPPALPPQERAARALVSGEITVGYLLGLYKDRTELQGDKFSAPYIGKWINISGRVTSITAFNDKTTTLSVKPSDMPRTGYYLWMMFEGDREALEAMPPDSEIRARGRIKSISSYEIQLLECELL